VLIAFIAVSVLISTVAASRLLTEQGLNMYAEQSAQFPTTGKDDSASPQATEGESNDGLASNNEMPVDEQEGWTDPERQA